MRIAISVVIFGTFGCASCAPRVPEPIGRAAVLSCKDTSAGSIAMQAQYLSNYSQSNAAGSTPPDPSTNISPIGSDQQGQNIVAALTSALSLAKPEFRHRLCRDNTYLLVNIDDKAGTFAGAYAFWQTEAEAAPNPPVRFISIPLGVFTKPPSYSSYESGLINALVNTVNGTVDGSNVYTASAASSSDDTATALLAMIAHEEGHIIAQRHLGPKADHPTPCLSDHVDYTYYTWSDPGNIPTYHAFGADVGAKHKTNDPFPAAITMAAARDKVNHTMDADAGMTLLYKTNGNFPSLFAALAPDDDIAEAYKYHVLRKGQPGLSLTVTLPETGTSILVFEHLGGSSKNSKKEACLNSAEADDS